ncbi:MAG TPA: hypothetical protein VF163_02245 [Micromonosporaceae bacterium]
MLNYTAASLYGTTPQGPSYGVPVAAPTAGMATDDIRSGWRGLVDPHNPLMWFGAILAVTFGLAGVAGSVRLGRAKLSGSIDRG